MGVLPNLHGLGADGVRNFEVRVAAFCFGYTICFPAVLIIKLSRSCWPMED